MANTNAAYARSYLESKGYSPEIAAAIVGNLMQESYSDLRTGVMGDPNVKGGSWGIAQWNKGRLDNLKAFAANNGKPWTDLNTQLDFVDHELRGSGKFGGGAYNKVWDALQTGNLTDKTLAFRKMYEVAAPEADSKRIANAAGILGVAVPAGYSPSSEAPPSLAYSDAGPSFSRAAGSTSDKMATLPGPAQPIIQAAADISKVSQPSTQSLINKAVQLSTRRGETIPGWPGAGPSRGSAIDLQLRNNYVGQPSTPPTNISQATPATPPATTPPAATDGLNLPPSPAYAQSNMQGGPGQPPNALAALFQQNPNMLAGLQSSPLFKSLGKLFGLA